MKNLLKKSNDEEGIKNPVLPSSWQKWAKWLSRFIYGSSEQEDSLKVSLRVPGAPEKEGTVGQGPAAPFYLSNKAFRKNNKLFFKNALLTCLFILVLCWIILALFYWEIVLSVVLIFIESQLLKLIPWQTIFPEQDRQKTFFQAVECICPPFFLFGLAFALAIVGQIFLIRLQFKPGSIFYLAAIALAYFYEKRTGSGVPLDAQPVPNSTPGNPSRTVSRPVSLNPFYIFVPLMLYSTALTYLTTDIYKYKISDIQQYGSLSLWAGSIGLFMFGLWWADPVKFPRNSDPLTRYQKIGLAAILIMAAAARLYRLNDIPHGMIHDEVAQLLLSFSIPMPFQINEWFTENFTEFLSGISWYLSFKFLPVDNCVGFRLGNAIPGIFTVYLIFQFTRFCFGNRAALITAFIWAFSLMPVSISRSTYCEVHVPMVTVGVTYFLYKGLKLRRSIDFAWAGFFLSFGFYSYPSLRIVPFIVLFFLIFLFFKDRKMIEENRQGLIVFVAVILAWMYPLFNETYFKNQDIWSRAKAIFTLKGAPVLLWPYYIVQNYFRILYEYYCSATMYSEYCIRWMGLPGKPIFDLITAASSIACLGIALRRLKDAAFLLVLMTALLSITPQAITPFGYPTARTCGFLPPIIMLAGIFLSRGYELTLLTTLRPCKSWLLGLLAVILGFVCIYNLHFYFVSNAQYADFFPQNEGLLGNEGVFEGSKKEMEFDKLGYAVSSEFAAHPTAIVETGYRVHNVLGFYAPYDTPYLRKLNKDFQGIVYFFYPNKNDERKNILKALYPGGHYCALLNPKTNNEVYWSYIAGRNEVLADQGLHGLYYDNLNFEGRPVTRTAWEKVSYLWKAKRRPVKPPFSARYSGGVYFAVDQSHTFTLEAMDQTRLFIDDKLVLSLEQSDRVTSVSTPILPMKAGPHRLRVEAKVRSVKGSLNLYWNSIINGQEIMPREALLPPAIVERLFVLNNKKMLLPISKK